MKKFDLNNVKEHTLYFENDEDVKRKGTLVVVNYNKYYKPENIKYMASMLLSLTNWKSNKMDVVDFRTFQGTESIYIYFDCDVEQALKWVSKIDYLDEDRNGMLEIEYTEDCDVYELELETQLDEAVVLIKNR